MSDIAVDKWKQTGNLYLWRYVENERNFPGWHITADKTFYDSFADLIEKMLSSKWSSKKLITLTPPSLKILKVPNNRGGTARWETGNSLLLERAASKVDESFFTIVVRDDFVVLSASSRQLKFFRDCLFRIFQAENDFSITAGNTKLWFW